MICTQDAVSLLSSTQHRKTILFSLFRYFLIPQNLVQWHHFTAFIW